MYIGYFDEFGHNGPYISRQDPSYKTHPVFGLGGFIIPADNVRKLSGAFRTIKETGLQEEIDAKVLARGKRVEHWEKKGAALLTTRNIETYRETRRIIARTLNALERLNAQVVFYGQEKPRGTFEQTGESNQDRYDHAIKQLIARTQWSIPDDENFLMVLDKQGIKERMEVFAGAAAFMFSNQDATRLLEPPMEVESHLYQTVQCADWICALLGRIGAYKFDPDFAEFSWAPTYFGKRLAQVTSSKSKIRSCTGETLDMFPRHLGSLKTCYNIQDPLPPQQS
ncbi:hypothetical protein BSR28_06080 [Boudabousia liubingyangii]|uniref:DUF3800 domain-containing protein n=1 Tax=Boudabousia liubingyangii TaxID=1921764 RepID=UPI00093DF658|nr:DUF3800 domain-containing protein [Boudabousia liubingyangii]OKL46985.1 hypothetical protein BSR28_06080 [Boudabousia liubingyangii]